MEKWQCQKVSKFSEVLVFKDPNSYQHWQREQGSFISECCLLKDDEALKDFDKEVTINTTDVFKKGLENGHYNRAEKDTQWDAHYRMVIPLKTKGNVLIKMTFELSHVEEGVTEEEIEKTKKSILHIKKIWDGNFTLKVTNILNHYCPVQLPIQFDIQFAYEGQKIPNGERKPHLIDLYKIVPMTPEGIDRPRLEGGKTFILETKRKAYNIPYVYAHEFAHALGLPDEYGYDNIIDSIVQYYKPDGSLDMTKIPAFHQNKSKQKDDPTESIMGVYDSCKITERQGWVLGIAAQKIIDPRRKKYKCDIIFNGTTKPCNF